MSATIVKLIVLKIEDVQFISEVCVTLFVYLLSHCLLLNRLNFQVSPDEITWYPSYAWCVF